MDENDLPDDPEILSTAELWRRIPLYTLVYDENLKGIRISSAAFRDSRDGSPMSVFEADEMTARGLGAEDALTDYEGYGLARISAQNARDHHQRLARTPQHGLAHVSVIGNKRKVDRELAKLARWVIRNPVDAILEHFAVHHPQHLSHIEGTDIHANLYPKD